MKFFKRWHFTNNFVLLDTAFFVALLPILFIIELPMLLFLFVGIVFVFKKWHKMQYVLLVFGLLMLGFSMGVLEIERLGSLPWFVEFIISLLLIAVMMQRLSQKINFYLVISPFLLMVLSLFFSNTIASLFFTILQLFIFTTLYLLYFMQKPLLDGLKGAAILFFISLPVIVVLFLFFPRISFDRGDFGFREDASAVFGHDGSMHLDASALSVISNKKMMEVEFFDGVPNSDALYFRGSVLYEKKDGIWVEDENLQRALPLNAQAEFVNYRIALQPHYRHYVYSLDYPIAATSDAQLSHGHTIHSDKSIVQEYRYELTSALKYIDLDLGQEDSIYFDASKNLQAQEQLQGLLELEKEQRLQGLASFFRSLNLSYTLNPPQYDMQNFVDSFLFDHAQGYCVHFASAFAMAARMVGINSRVVTGFVGKEENRVNEYLIIRQRDAHAWVELFLDERGWVRVDPTSFAGVNLSQEFFETSKATQWGLQLNYLKYKIQTWVLHYNYLTQREFFQNLRTDREYLLKFVAFIAGLAFVGLIVFLTFMSSRCGDRVDCMMQRLLKKLAKKGIVWDKKESLHRFLLQNDFKEIDRLYLKLKFSKEYSKSDEKRLKELIKNLV